MAHERTWWSRSESNRRPLQCDCSALPSELRPRQLRFPPLGLPCQGSRRAADLHRLRVRTATMSPIWRQPSPRSIQILTIRQRLACPMRVEADTRGIEEPHGPRHVRKDAMTNLIVYVLGFSQSTHRVVYLFDFLLSHSELAGKLQRHQSLQSLRARRRPILRRSDEPALRPIRNALPNLGPVDISPVVLIFACMFVQGLILNVIIPAVATGMAGDERRPHLAQTRDLRHRARAPDAKIVQRCN